MTKYVQFSDSTDTAVIGVFCGPQDPDVYANLGEVEDDDLRYLAFMDPSSIPPTPDQILATNQAQQVALLTQASQVMAPILVSLQLGDATDAETLSAKAWQAYYRALKLVDVTVESPDWPVSPE